VEALVYFTNLYTHLPTGTTAEQLKALLLWNVKALLAPQARGNQDEKTSSSKP
jgi:hypothetical protein